MEPSSALLTDRVAIVTGAGRGIGLGIARTYAAFGAHVACVDIDAATARSAAAEVEARGRRALACHTDVRDPDAVDAMVRSVVERLGRIDILVNNVGDYTYASFPEAGREHWKPMIEANLMGTLHCCHAASRAMLEARRGGSIINVTTIEADRAAPMLAVYSAAKGGVAQFTKSLALELAPHGIRVNALAPDFILTPGIAQHVDDPDPAAHRYHIPLGRVGLPDDMAGPAVFLASALSAYVTGETIFVTGGTHAAGGWLNHPRLGWVLAPPIAPTEPR